jgi:hypothetical protein
MLGLKSKIRLTIIRGNSRIYNKEMGKLRAKSLLFTISPPIIWLGPILPDKVVLLDRLAQPL